MSLTSDQWKEKIASLLVGINRYNPDNVDTLEDYIRFQAEQDAYNFEANLALLKLYQFQPGRINMTVALQVLLKALINLPKTDFIMLKCVLPQDLQRNSSVQQIVSLHGLLESCQFKQFWTELKDCTEVTEHVKGFEEAIRTYICSVVDVSYQSVQLDLLRDYLGGLDDDSLSQLAASRGWQTVTREDGTKMMEIRKQEATIKPKKILAKIDFDSVSGILSAAAAR